MTLLRFLWLKRAGRRTSQLDSLQYGREAASARLIVSPAEAAVMTRSGGDNGEAELYPDLLAA